jgi:hypothetical protein
MFFSSSFVFTMVTGMVIFLGVFSCVFCGFNNGFFMNIHSIRTTYMCYLFMQEIVLDECLKRICVGRLHEYLITHNCQVFLLLIVQSIMLLLLLVSS